MRIKRWPSRLLTSLLILAIFFCHTGAVAEAQSGTWKHDPKGYWYSYSDGTYAKNEWLKSGGKWYYFNAKGYMVKNWLKIGSKWYYLGTNGAMKTGWQKIDGKWFYFDSKGIMQTGWKEIDNKWYCFNNNGQMITGWILIQDKDWYYLKKDGSMATGTLKIGNATYTFSSAGVLQNENKKGNGDVRTDLERYKQLMEPSVKETWGTNYSFEIKGNDAIITVWMDGIANAAYTTRLNKSYLLSSWRNARNAQQQGARNCYDYMVSIGVKNANCYYKLVDENNHNVVLLGFRNGELYYDVVDD